MTTICLVEGGTHTNHMRRVELHTGPSTIEQTRTHNFK